MLEESEELADGLAELAENTDLHQYCTAAIWSLESAIPSTEGSEQDRYMEQLGLYRQLLENLDRYD